MGNNGLRVLIHGSAFFLPLLGPFIIYLIIDDEVTKKIALQALVFQLMMSVLIFISMVLSLLIIGIPFLVVFGIMTWVVPIIGIVKAIQGHVYQYPIVKHWV